MKNNSNKHINTSEGTIASFFVGFAANHHNGIRLTNYKEVIEKINFSLCPTINTEIFYLIENKFFESKIFEKYVRIWAKLGNQEPVSINKLYDETTLNHDNSIKLDQKMIFAFFCGISCGIPPNFTERQFFKIYDKFLNKVAKKLCDQIDVERLCDLEDYLTSNLEIFEILDALLMKIHGRASWSKSAYTEFTPENEDEAMLKNFQEKYK